MKLSQAISILRERQTLAGHAPTTKRSYEAAVLQFIRCFPSDTSTNHNMTGAIESYLSAMRSFCSAATVNLHIDALRFFFDKALCKDMQYGGVMPGIKHLKADKPLPRVHSKEECLALIDQTRNTKHRLLLGICYGCGLRVSELCSLRVADVSLDRMQVVVRKGKGGKDRSVPLPMMCADLFETVCYGYGSLEYVFSGRKGGVYSSMSASKVYRAACNRIGVVGSGIHTLRHSFATHLIESGHDIEVVRRLLGHGSVKTTQRYTHISTRFLADVKSPLDDTMADVGESRRKLYKLAV